MSQYRNEYKSFEKDYYWTLPRILLSGAATLLVLGTLGFGANYMAYGTFNFFAPRYEATRRDVMIESRAYSEAVLRNMYNLKLQYVQAKTDQERDTIASMVRYESKSFDTKRLPNDLQIFINSMGN